VKTICSPEPTESKNKNTNLKDPLPYSSLRRASTIVAYLFVETTIWYLFEKQPSVFFVFDIEIPTRTLPPNKKKIALEKRQNLGTHLPHLESQRLCLSVCLLFD
jgi:hypothetical protein